MNNTNLYALKAIDALADLAINQKSLLINKDFNNHCVEIYLVAISTAANAALQIDENFVDLEAGALSLDKIRNYKVVYADGRVAD